MSNHRVLNYYGGRIDLALPDCISRPFATEGVLTRAEEGTIRCEVEAVLRRRRPVTIADWEDDATDFKIACVIGRAVGNWLEWPPDRFYPDDQLRYLLFADMADFGVAIALQRELGIAWRFEDTFPFFTGELNLRAFVKELRRRLEG